jgi:excisionase family DNA binding protein
VEPDSDISTPLDLHTEMRRYTGGTPRRGDLDLNRAPHAPHDMNLDRAYARLRDSPIRVPKLLLCNKNGSRLRHSGESSIAMGRRITLKTERLIQPGGEILTIQEVAELLKVPVGTVRKWRSEGMGPQGFRVGKHVRYRRSSVDLFIAEREAE